MSAPEAPPPPFARWATLKVYTALSVILLIVLLVIVPMPILELLVKLLVGLSWPLVVLIAALWFKPEIRKKLGDLSEIGKGVAKFSGAAQPQGTGDPTSPGLSPSGAPAPPVPADAGQPLRPEDTVAPVYRPLIAQINERLQERLPAAQQLTGRPPVELLAVWLCDSGAALLLERASRHVFESQLDALDGLKTAPSATASDFRAYYDRTQAAQFNYPFEAWLGFLTSFELITVSGETVQITPAGQVLSHYMAERGYGRGLAGT